MFFQICSSSCSLQSLQLRGDIVAVESHFSLEYGSSPQGQLNPSSVHAHALPHGLTKSELPIAHHGH
jgi:hypothetical protein